MFSKDKVQRSRQKKYLKMKDKQDKEIGENLREISKNGISPGLYLKCRTDTQILICGMLLLAISLDTIPTVNAKDYNDDTKNRKNTDGSSETLLVTKQNRTLSLTESSFPQDDIIITQVSSDNIAGNMHAAQKIVSATTAKPLQNNIVACKTKLQLLQKNNRKTWETYHIKYDRSLKKTVKAEEIWYAQKECEKALAQVLSEPSMFPFIPTPDLDIMLIPASIYEDAYGDIDGIFEFDNAIGIVFKHGNTYEDYAKVLKNELFHQQVFAKNKAIGAPIERTVLPFLDKQGNIDNYLLKKYEKAINMGKRAIDNYKLLLEKKKLSQQEQKKLTNFLKLTDSYIPYTHTKNLAGFNILVERKVMRIDANGKISTGINYPANGPKIYDGKILGDRVYFTFCPQQSPRGRAIALISDINAFFNHIDHPPYSNMPKEHRLKEIGSFLAEFKAEVLEYLFPDFNDYMCNYFNSQNTISSLPNNF